MRVAAFVAPALIAGGVAAVVAAVVTGSAQAGIVVVFPVIFGSSALFLVGVLLLIAGIFALPFAFGATEAVRESTDTTTSGGVVLIGPVPIFWGSASHVSRRTRLLAAAAGGLLLVVAAVLVLGWVH
jgi:uncharacterized membrane protein